MHDERTSARLGYVGHCGPAAVAGKGNPEPGSLQHGPASAKVAEHEHRPRCCGVKIGPAEVGLERGGCQGNRTVPRRARHATRTTTSRTAMSAGVGSRFRGSAARRPQDATVMGL